MDTYDVKIVTACGLCYTGYVQASSIEDAITIGEDGLFRRLIENITSVGIVKESKGEHNGD